MRNSIFDILNKPVANPNKNGFDLGQFFPVSYKLGQVKPMYFLHTVPQGHYSISVDELTHTEPFITDPFVRLSKHIECVFIPYSQLWHGATQFFAHTSDPQSSYEQGHDFVPNFSLGNMLARIDDANYTDIQGYNIKETALSLLDMLGYGAHPIYKMSTADKAAYINALKGVYVNAFPLLAYNKYWNTFLRDTQHTSPLNPSIFNADKVPCTSVATSHMDSYYTTNEMLELVTIKYRKVKRDVFTSALTSRQFGAVESVMFNISGSVQVGGTATLSASTGNDQNRYETTAPVGTLNDLRIGRTETTSTMAGTSSIDGQAYQVKHTHPVTGTATLGGQGSITGTSSGFDVYTLLTAQMMQKWREQIQRAGNQSEDRLRAVYGVSPASDAKNQPYLIGSTSYDITANQVTSTGSSDGAKLGDIAAKGIGYSNRNQFTFDATEFGVILVCSYILPENNYLAPIDKCNTMIEPFDFFTEQFDNLGLEQISPLLYRTVDFDPTTSSYKSLIGSVNSPGFAARYFGYKQKPNVIHLGFEHGRENSKWIPSRITLAGAGGTYQNPYYISPNEYDTVFGTETDWHLDTDQFVGCARVNCDAVLPMSELGIPRW